MKQRELIVAGKLKTELAVRSFIMYLISFVAIFVLSLNPVISQTGGNINVSGTILDESNEALIGVTIAISGTTTGTISDIDGHFILDVKSGDTLIISYVGYTTQLIPISDQTTLSIVLVDDITKLDEVVVVSLWLCQTGQPCRFRSKHIRR